MSKELEWNSKVDLLFKSKKSKNLEKLNETGIHTLYDLLWIFPLHSQILPALAQFNKVNENELFQGKGNVISFISRPNFKQKGKGNTILENITMIVQDTQSNQTIQLKWFNNYPSQINKLKSIKIIHFWGEVSQYQGTFQIVNPKIIEDKSQYDTDSLLITYPTINGVGPSHIIKLINKIPQTLWENIPETIPSNIIEKRNLIHLQEAFLKLHGKFANIEKWKNIKYEDAKNRIIYEELLIDQLKIYLRREKCQKLDSPQISISESKLNNFIKNYQYELTKDQLLVLEDIKKDLEMPHPMMRLVQGDVGCGKTTVAQIAAYIVSSESGQVALMCPTEALAYQHLKTFNEIFSHSNIRIELILGSTKQNKKNEIKKNLKEGKIQIIIGTHSLIQNDIHFKNLQLAIIDEQHKFGVKQRLALTSKTPGCNCLIMTATPIPRSLSLTQYGDLEISTIKVLPAGRKKINTRIVQPENFEKFLSFFKTRLSMGEQAYLVVPAITENPEIDIHNLESVLIRFKNFFPEYKIEALHGQMKAREKSQVFDLFNNKKIDVLISTSVVEVGIDVPNSTIMAILNPERFGLSSLHQLRGRIGRGGMPGFCFLILDKKISQDSLNRLKVIESSTDGFQIAEEDLRIRGEGDIFGKEQSGSNTQKRFSNTITHQNVIEQIREDLPIIIEKEDDIFTQVFKRTHSEEFIYTTV